MKRRIIHIDEEKCNGCGACAAACHEGAIEMVDGKPEVDHGKCIRCYCCHELCPENAVLIKRPRGEKFISRL